MDFSKLKSRRGSTNFGALAERVTKATSKGSSGGKDERIYYPKLDDAKNGYAKIRFIESKFTDDDKELGKAIPEFAKLYQHVWKDDETGRWHFHHCPTTIEKDCPICEKNSELWNTGTKENQNLVRNRKRKLSYYTNIVVVEDPQNPENNGKVFLYKFGAKIFDKIKNALFPEFADESPFNPFDFWEGATFKLKIRRVEGQINYDKSEFESPSTLDTDDTMKKLYDQTYDLREFIKPDLFDDHETLEEKAFGSKRSFAAKSSSSAVEETKTSTADKFKSKSSEDTPFKSDKEIVNDRTGVSSNSSTSSEESDDDIDAYFNKLTS